MTITIKKETSEELLTKFLKKHGRFFASVDFVHETGELEEHDFYETFVALAEDQDVVSGVCPCSPNSVSLASADLFMWTDYMTNPMVWCDKCGRRSFICINCKPTIVDNGDTISYICPLVTITNVRNRQVNDWKWTEKEFLNGTFEAFVEIRRNTQLSYSQIEDTEDEFCAQHGIKPTDPDDKIDWDLSVLCNSTNAEDVKLPLDMAHDGILIRCLCHCEGCNSTFKACYWGD